jgi:hypothetical protein
MNPPTAPSAPTREAERRRAPERMRSLEGLSAETREDLLERVRAARRRLAKASPGLARLR